MITNISHKVYIHEKMKEDPVDHDIVSFYYSHQKPKEKNKKGGSKATPLTNIEIRKGSDQV